MSKKVKETENNKTQDEGCQQDISENIQPEQEITDNTNKPLDYAMDLVEESGFSFNDWKRRNLGLQLSLLGMAGAQAKRSTKILNLVSRLEELIIDENSLTQLLPDQRINLYEIANKSLKESNKFIAQIILGIDWDKIESELASFETKNSIEDVTELSVDSDNLLQEIIKQLKMVPTESKQIEDKSNKKKINENK